MESGIDKIKKWRSVLPATILPAFILLLMYLHMFAPQKKVVKEGINVPVNISQGDFILRKGKGWMSHIIENILQDGTGVSHCGIIIQDAESCTGFSVIDALSEHVSDANGIRKTCLSDFMRESVAGTNKIFRHKAVTLDIAGALSQDAQSILEQALPFDHSFNLGNHDALFCSELLYILCKKNLGDTLYKESKSYNYSFAVFQDTSKFIQVWPIIKKPPESGF